MDVCYDCLKPTVKKQGPITLNKLGYGSYEVLGVIYYACDVCGSKIIPPDEAKRIEEEGVELHMLKVLKNCSQPIPALDLKEELCSEATTMETVALRLVKQNKIIVDYSNPSIPTLIAVKKEEKKTFWDLLKSLINRR